MDECPFDAEDDADGDGICGDIDTCPYDAENDIDNDQICGDVDECPYDGENDADNDGICGDEDTCPYDYENDYDQDGICGDVDECDYDYENDADGDGICGDVDPCPYDAENDADSDGLCADVDECDYDPLNDADGDGLCCSDEDGDGVVDDTGLDYDGNPEEACSCATNYFDCSSDCVVEDSEDADTVDNCGTCDDIDWNDCETSVLELEDNANLSSFFVLPEDSSLDNIFSDITDNLLAVAGSGFAALYQDGDFIGDLESLNQLNGYWIVMGESDDLSILGTPIDPATGYTINLGANLIGYPLNVNTEFGIAMGSELFENNIYAVFGQGQSAYNHPDMGLSLIHI